ncbi:lipopolysaccharide assembly protein LapB [Dyella sp. C9]|uniref:tetratricopeptide repeat protein n=1 Tax=Dyella sp. C9 TaxID=2202154 RepID=UPI000DEEF244|nr:hypothetical protein [Dyella sp. C9]
MNKWLMLGLAGAILAAIAFTYMPVIHAGFIWDDWPSFRDLQGERWLHYVFRDFNQWTIYFRPLVVAFLALQVKLFHGAPGPMHVVSLALHLVNVVLVGALAYRVGALTGAPRVRQAWAMLVCMLIYGLHPALIETVSWIGCQFDLMATLITLLGLVANTYIRRTWIRAATLAVLCFLAACAKESGGMLPLLVVLFDIALYARTSARTISAIAGTVLRRNGLAYAGMAIAGLAYLASRHLALPPPQATPIFGKTIWWVWMQEISLTYLCYLKVILWPMAGIAPLHPKDASVVQTVTAMSLLTCAAFFGVIGMGFWLALKRGAAVGFMIVGATIALLPVLRLIPVDFDHNLYHERYATMAIAVVCALAPLIRWPQTTPPSSSVASALRLLSPVALALWLALCVVDIRLLAPNWANDVALWRWALALDPQSTTARDNLLLSYDRNGDSANAQKLTDEILADTATCTSCLLHIAGMSIDRNDPVRATAALKKASDTFLVRRSPEARQIYDRELGRLMAMQGHYDYAQQLLKESLAIKPNDPVAQAALIEALAAKEKTDERQ